MLSATVEENTATMSIESRKRPAVTDHDSSDAKRQRVQSPHVILSVGQIGASPCSSTAATTDELANKGLRRAVALALEKVGFEGATPDAMESFTAMVETYITSLGECVRTYQNAARRAHPIPGDFELALGRFNLTTSLLDPHRKPPIPKSKRLPTLEPLAVNDRLEKDLPILGEELDGAPDKAVKAYIPDSFPAFPSIHTYKCTPESVDAVTVSDDWGVFSPDAPQQSLEGSQLHPQQPQRPLAPDEIPRGDPKKMREAAAKEAKAGEGALRRLMRASKIAKQKEVWSAAQRQPARRDRYNLWEAAMRELIEDDTKSKGKEIVPAAMHGDKGRFEIADHSMIVNTEKACLRQDIPRAGVRKAVTTGHGIPGKG
ncbi:Bromodomain associated-domain-containing protein [Chaetomium sp. MPI-CAGE-AT-0009]|nr:Bromodomain associated-domain-containing protein [Chaetomium sp. MPI-CAGE-AT-0009]